MQHADVITTDNHVRKTPEVSDRRRQGASEAVRVEGQRSVHNITPASRPSSSEVVPTPATQASNHWQS